MSPAAARPSKERTRAWRERKKACLLGPHTLYIPPAVVEFLLNTERLTEREALRRRSREAAMVQVLVELAERWQP